MQNKWIVKASAADIRNNPTTIEIAEKLDIKLPTAQLLVNRGYTTPEAAAIFLAKSGEMLHDPFVMKDMRKAVKKLSESVNEGKRIAIYGDYDVDGVTSVSILYMYLKKIGADVEYYIPSRIGEGYGMSEGSLTRLKEEGVEVIVTVDTGITAVEEAKFARELGITLIITDHHECHGDLPDAYAIVNPRQPDCEYPFKELAGVGVVYKFLCALESERNPGDELVNCVRRISSEYSDLVAIGTVADVMPIRDENRLIVSRGLSMIQNLPRPGLTELFHASDNNGKYGKAPKISSGFIGYTVAPRLNAAGRIENASTAVELFLAGTRAEAEPIAKQLCEINRKRQIEENKIMDAAYERITEGHDFDRDPVIVLEDECWHHGIIGIVSSRITEKYGCPSILISFDKKGGSFEHTEVDPSSLSDDDIGKGSGRSVKGMNLVEALTYCRDLLEKHGGHELAAGLSIKRGNLEEFKKRINEYARECFSKEMLTPVIEADCELLPEDLTMAQSDELYRLEPYGISNPVPAFVVRNMVISDISSVGGGRHTKLIVRRDNISLVAMCFRKTMAEVDLYPGDNVDILFNLDVNEFQNNKSLQFIVKDIALSDEQNKYEQTSHQVYSELWNYISKGEQLSVVPSSDTVPDRNDFAAVYNVLKHELHLEHEIFSLRALEHLLRMNGYRIGYVKLKFIIKVFQELNLIGVNEMDEEREIYKFNYIFVKNKTSLDKSNIYRKLKSACQTR